MSSVQSLLSDIQACTICQAHLPNPPRPILQVHESAKILIAGQAPGRKAHDSGIPFDDASGDRLREWMGVDRATFYDPTRVAIVPMGFCFPGTGSSGDLPPRPECVRNWHERLLSQLQAVELTLVIGQYAQAYYLPGPKQSVTAQVKRWTELWPSKVPLPHPSPRNNRWLSKNPWFERDVLPALQDRIAQLLTDK